jgi:signal transduction histidine kinase/Tfp pilus assembly protein PilF
MKAFAPFFFILVFPFWLFAQTTEQDSLLQLINTTENDSIKTKSLIDLAWTYDRTEWKKQYIYAKEAFERSRELNNVHLQMLSLHVLGDSYLSFEGRSDSALVYLKKGLSLATDVDSSVIKADFLKSIGVFYHILGTYDTAFEYYQQAIVIAENEHLEERLCRYLNNMAIILMRQKKYDSALIYFQQALKIAQKLDNKLIISTLLSNMGIIHSNRGEYDEALAVYYHSLDVKKSENDKLGEVITICNIGNVYNRKGLYERALEYQKNGLRLAEKIDFTRGKSTCLEGLTFTYFDSKQYNKAIQSAKLGLEVSEKKDLLENQVDFKDLMSKSYAQLGNYTLAYKIQSEYMLLNDSLNSLASLKQINELEAKYQLRQKETENQLFKEKQIRQEEELKKRNLLIIAILIISILTILTAIIYYNASRRKQRYNEQLQKDINERTAELKASNQELKNINNELESFAYITSHDLKEPLRNILLYNGLIQKKLKNKASDEVNRYFSIINESGKQMHHLIGSILQFSKLDRIDLHYDDTNINHIVDQTKDSLRHLIEQKNAVIEVDALPIIQSSYDQLFLVFKNLIENGIKYNESKRPTVSITHREGTHHQFLIRDNGIGIPPKFHDKIFLMFKRLQNRSNSQGSGLGLSIANKVVHRLGGSISIESEKDNGSTFIIQLPINRIQGKYQSVEMLHDIK